MERSSGTRRTQRGGRDIAKRPGPRVGSSSEVFVSNLSWEVTEDSLQQLFSPCGLITRVKILTSPDGRSKGVGFVTFETAEAMQSALAMNGQEFLGRTLRVNIAGDRPAAKSSPTQVPPLVSSTTNVIFVGNLSYQCTESDIRDFFQPCGEIQEIRVPRDAEGRMKGFGFVTFREVEAAARAMQLNGRELSGRQVRTELSKSTKPQGSAMSAAPQQGKAGGWD